MRPKLLDCTLRDGGYYNNWNFQAETVSRYLKALSKSGVRYVELGLRNFPKSGFHGLYAYTPEVMINDLELPDELEYGVMVDAKTILNSSRDISDAVEALFIPAKSSRLSLVRVAAHFTEASECQPIVSKLSEMGYVVGLNLMQSGGKSSLLLTDLATTINSWGCVDVLYFADSLGNMDAEEVSRIIGALKKGWNKELGIHAHNNQGLALQNTLHALSEGVSWLDATVTGMGRGAGNTQTELLLAELEGNFSGFTSKELYTLVLGDFEPLKQHYGWGSSLLYYLAAKNDVHPTYIQNMMADNRYGPEEMSKAIEYLSKCKSMSYDGQLFELALVNQNNNYSTQSGDVVTNLGFDVVNLIGGGDTNSHLKGIREFIKNSGYPTYSVNLNENLDQLIERYFISHNVKYLTDNQKYRNVEQPFVLPVSRFSDAEFDTLPKNTINYTLEITEDTFDVRSTGCVIPMEYTFFYAIAYLIAAGVKRVNLIGFDGYGNNDPRTQTINSWLTKIQDLFDIEFVSMTPTLYAVKSESIYAYC